MKKRILNVIITIIYILLSILFAGSAYLAKFFPNTSFEQTFYSVLFDSGGAPNVMINDMILYFILYSLPFLILLFLPIILEKIFNIKIKYKILIISKCIAILVLACISLFNIKFFHYISYQFNTSTIYEEKYINPNNVNITLNKKKNLIYIYVESMESTYSNLKIDGKNLSLIPELEKIAKENINFSNSNEIGGAYQLYGTAWTKAADVATSAGISTKLNLKGNFIKDYKNAYKNVKTLGEILKEFGYKNYLLLGSEPNFAGTRKFYESHGNYSIMGFSEAVNKGYIKNSEYKNWGIEDEKLLEIAKKELTRISKNKTPFNYTIFTIDSHFPGYVNSKCNNKYKDLFANSVSCESYILNSFIDWLKEQDFYNDSVIVITGDHIAMENKQYLKNKNRTIYNAFINSEVKSSNYKNRNFSTLDMYPTVLASLGAVIEGNRLGLGVNLFSDEKTIIEEYGYEKVQQELKAKSLYYNKHILK